uniref:Metaxin glutathione S-transferase domain-containing protein n=1 Tax=Rhodosorus marinus TaxID=101924 RepID=A0A7S0BU18_9RHOD
MKEGGHDVDRQLTMVQKSEAAAFRSLVQDADLARIFEWWIEKKSFQLGLKSLLQEDYRFPMSEIYPRWRRSKVLHERRVAAVEDELFSLAEDAYGCLESRLGRRNWFFGEHPTTVDAFVFGYFGCASLGQISDGKLSEMLSNGFPSLMELVKRVRERYFNTLSSANFVQPQSEPRKSKAPVRSPEEERTWTVSMRYAAGMMIAFFGYIYFASEPVIEFMET